MTDFRTEIEKKYGGNARLSRIDAHIRVWSERLNPTRVAWCFVGVMESTHRTSLGQIGVAEYGTGGYTPTFLYAETFPLAMELADFMNGKMGITPDQALKIIGDTMKRPANMECAHV